MGAGIGIDQERRLHGADHHLGAMGKPLLAHRLVQQPVAIKDAARVRPLVIDGAALPAGEMRAPLPRRLVQLVHRHQLAAQGTLAALAVMGVHPSDLFCAAHQPITAG